MKLCLVLLFIEKHNKQKKEKKWAHTYETILWPGGGIWLFSLSSFRSSPALPAAAISSNLSKINGVKYVMYPYVCTSTFNPAGPSQAMNPPLHMYIQYIHTYDYIYYRLR